MSKVKIMSLGGVRENGKNLNVVEVDDEIYVLDCGLKYPENELLGIDIVIPDLSYLETNIDRVVGVFLTHGHADAIGALPYFLLNHDIPVFGSELTIELAKITVSSEKKLSQYANFHVIDDSTAIDFEKATVSFFKTTHSIPGSLGIVIKTDVGQVVYTGDFKFDQSATAMYQTDFARLAEIGKQPVIALLSDSANAELAGENANEYDIADQILETFKYQEGRIIVASVASNIMRIQQILDAAYKTDRKVVLTGHDLEKIVKTAMKLGMIVLPDDNILVAPKDLKKLAPEQTVILETGKMGEPIKSLQKMATNRHRLIKIQPGDLVYITTTTSHAMETVVAKTTDMIYRAGGEVQSISRQLKASGHANKNDLQLMLNLMKPMNLVPVQGEYRQLAAHAEIAQETGMPADHIFLISKGDALVFEKNELRLAAGIEANDVMIDGSGIGDIGNIVLRDRKLLADDGIFIAVVTIDRKNKQIVAEPKVTARGFVYVKASKDLMSESINIIKTTIQNNLDNKEFDWSQLKQDVREHVSHYLYEQTKRRPVILPVIMEVNQNRRRSNIKRHQKSNVKPSTPKQAE